MSIIFIRDLCRNMSDLQMKEYLERLHMELIKAQPQA
jgi:hypothetical protein